MACSSRSFMFHVLRFTQLTFDGAASTRAPALKFKQRSDRRITMDSLNGFAQKARDRQGRDVHPCNNRAENSISCHQFVNRGFSQSFDPHFVEDGMRDTGDYLPGALAFKQPGGFAERA